MLRNLLLSTVLVASAGSALAADLPYRTAAPAPYVAAPIFTWTGFYVGLNAGGAWNNNSSLSTFGFTAPNPVIYGGTASDDDIGFTGGAQAGYNMQFGSFVLGVEADINYLDRKSGGSGSFPAASNLTAGFDDRSDFAVSRGDSDKYFGTVRARVGFAFDRALIFGTGGLAYGGKVGGSSVTQRNLFEDTDPATLLPAGTFTGPNNTRTILGSTGGSNSSVGWTLGGGVEYAFTNSMSLKLEYLHVNLGSSSRTFTTVAGFGGVAGGETITIKNDNKFDVVRAGVNFRF